MAPKNEAKAQEEKPDFKYVIRIESTDLNGNKNIVVSLTSIDGIGDNLARAVLRVAKIPFGKKTGYLTDEEVAKIDDIIRNLDKYNIPLYMFNRRRDYDTGVDKHLIGNAVKFTEDQDIKRMKKIRTWVGLRHMFNLPVRGQRTNSNHRRTKVIKKRKTRK